MTYPTDDEIIKYLQNRYNELNDQIVDADRELSFLKELQDEVADKMHAIGSLDENERIPLGLIPKELIEKSVKEEQEKLEKWKKSVDTKV
jgi:hypothetical protein